MWCLSLRCKIALLAVASCAVALAGGALSTWFFLRRAEIHTLDERLRTGAQEFFVNLDDFEGGPRERRTEITDRFVPVEMRDRFIELVGRHGESLYRSENLGEASLADAPRGFSTRLLQGQLVRVGVFNHEDLRLFVGADLAEAHRLERKLGFAFLVALPVVMLLIALTGSFLGWRAMQPVNAVAQAAEQISADHLERRLPEPRAQDEIHRLVAVLNRTFERLQRSFEQAGRFSADASHQLKTPLTVLRAGLDALLQSPRLHPDDQTAVSELLDQTRRLTSLTEDLLLLARADAGRIELRRTPGDLRPIFEDCLEDARALAENGALTVEAEIPARLEAAVDPRYLTMIVQNLLENAVKYNRPGGRISLRVSTAPPWLELRVGNTGEPISQERRAHIFERFSRGLTDERIAGSGLGLSLAHELARAHGGELELAESSADWTEFRLRLPLSEK